MLARVDERLIHGQIINEWVALTNPTHLLILDEVLVADEFMANIYKALAPLWLEVQIFAPADSIPYLCALSEDSRIFLLAKNPQPFEELLKRGIPLEEVVLADNQPAPNLAWVSDITEIKTKDGKYHLCVIIDLFSRKVISYQLSEQNDAALVRATFQQAYHVRGLPEGLLFHSDQGTQYTSFDFQSLLIHHSVMQSFSNPGVPYDNAAMESFFSHLKTEEIHRYTYRSADELLAAIKEYIHFHNHQRPHSSIGNLTPEQVEQQYQAQKCNNGLVELADVRENRN